MAEVGNGDDRRAGAAHAGGGRGQPGPPAEVGVDLPVAAHGGPMPARPRTTPGPPTRAATLSDFRDRHAGQTVVVCGCGPSLPELRDPAAWVTIGVNDVGRLFDPTYLVVVNPPQQFAAGRFEHVRRSRARALFTQLDLGPVAPPVVRFALGQRGGTDDGGGRVLHHTQNSPYVAVGLAAWMGASRIVLIGVDFSDDHFFGATGPHPLAPRLAAIDAEYARLAQALRARGVALVNLSSRSRLTALPRISGLGRQPTVVHAAPPATPDGVAAELGHGRGPHLGRRAGMRVTVDPAAGGAVGLLLDALAGSAVALGHAVARVRAAAWPGHSLAIVWNGRHLRGRRDVGPVLYCEHGWLPRSDYQISPAGINADSHAAPFRWHGRPLAQHEDAALQARLEALRGAALRDAGARAAAAQSASLPARFLLVPLQVESDTNILRHAPPGLRTMQALVDHVSRLDPPWPVVFKQHPADARRGASQLALRLRRPQDRLRPHAHGELHPMLAGGCCVGVLTINSNVAHDALLWDLPAIVLGRNVWPADGAVTPFATACPSDWSQLAAGPASAEVAACRRAYAWHLVRHQWTLEAARDPRQVAGLIAQALERAGASGAPPAPRPAASGCGRTPPPTGAPAGMARVTPAVPPMPPAPATRPRLPTAAPAGPAPDARPLRVNAVAAPRGWLFACWQRQLAAVRLPGILVQASATPLHDADAWVFVRAREAGASPDPSRSVVQLHDLLDGGRYEPQGERGAVRRCAGLSLTHPHQRTLLEAAGIDLSARRCLLQPVGHMSTGPRPPTRRRRTGLPTVAWVGRPAVHDGVEQAGLDRFVAAAITLRGRARVLLVGEGLGPAADRLRRTGVPVQWRGLARCPIADAGHWLAGIDLLVITGAADAGPWPLFDAVAAGVPVLAPRVGWAEVLLGGGPSGGRSGALIDDLDALPLALSDRLAALADSHHATHDTDAPGTAALVRQWTVAAWAQANVELAAALAGAGAGTGAVIGRGAVQRAA
jgi:hypothetical protein